MTKKLILSFLALLLLFTIACNKTELEANKTVSNSKPSAVLEIESALIYKYGGVQPNARTSFYLLDKSAKEILKSAAVMPQGEKFEQTKAALAKQGQNIEDANPLFWIKIASKYPDYFPGFLPKALSEIKKHIVKSTTTDLQGKAKFEGLEYGRYYIYGTVEARDGWAVIWDLPIEIKDEKQSLILDQNNALELD